MCAEIKAQAQYAFQKTFGEKGIKARGREMRVSNSTREHLIPENLSKVTFDRSDIVPLQNTRNS